MKVNVVKVIGLAFASGVALGIGDDAYKGAKKVAKHVHSKKKQMDERNEKAYKKAFNDVEETQEKIFKKKCLGFYRPKER